METLVLFILIQLFYLGSAITIAARLFSEKAQYLPRTLGLVLGACGLLIQILLFYITLITPAGVNLGFFNALSLVAWFVMAMLLVSSVTKPVENLGIVVFPVGIMVLWLERYFPTVHFISSSTPWGLKIHIIVSFLAYSMFALATVQALLLAVQDHHLHIRQPWGFIRALPPLQTMEVLLFEMIGIGFLLLTLSIISGFLFLKDVFAQHLFHKTLLSVFCWCLFGTLLLGRARAGWRGRTAVIWTISGFTILVLAYFGTRAVVELILRHY